MDKTLKQLHKERDNYNLENGLSDCIFVGGQLNGTLMTFPDSITKYHFLLENADGSYYLPFTEAWYKRIGNKFYYPTLDEIEQFKNSI